MRESESERERERERENFDIWLWANFNFYNGTRAESSLHALLAELAELAELERENSAQPTLIFSSSRVHVRKIKVALAEF